MKKRLLLRMSGWFPLGPVRECASAKSWRAILSSSSSQHYYKSSCSACRKVILCRRRYLFREWYWPPSRSKLKFPGEFSFLLLCLIQTYRRRCMMAFRLFRIKDFQENLNICSVDFQISECVLRQCPEFHFTLNSVWKKLRVKAAFHKVQFIVTCTHRARSFSVLTDGVNI